MYRTVLGPVFCSCKTGIHYIHVNKGRFKSQALLDKAALMTCMAYVDLNPIRANMAESPEKSDYVSVKERIREHLGKSHAADNLLTMDGNNQHSQGIPFYLNDYLELLDWSGRAIRENKAGSIPMKLLPILRRLQVESNTWINQVNHFGKRWYRVAGTKEKVKILAHKIGLKWMNGQGNQNPFVASG